MATRMQQRRGTAAQWISTNAGAGPVLNAGEIGWESDTNKFKIGDGTNNWSSLDYFFDANSTLNPAFGSSITFEGATANDHETTLAITDPTADRTITFPDATGTVALTSDITVTATSTTTLTNKTLTSPVVTGLVINDGSIVVEGSAADEFETTLTFTNPTADHVITFPNATFTVASTADISAATGGSVTETGTQTLTNKTLTTPTISSITNTGTLTLPTSTDTLVGRATTDTLTNKTLTSPVLGGTTTTASGNLILDPATKIVEVKGDGASVVGQIQLNCHVNTHGQKIASQPHSENATNTLKLPGGTVIGNGDAVLVSDTGTQTLTNKTLTSPTLTTPNIGAATGTSLTLSGDLTINGTTTNINSTNLVVEDKNIVLGDTAEPTDTTADGGGITLKGATDHTFNWVNATDAWTSSEHLDLASDKEYKINNISLKDVTETLTNKTLSSAVLSGTFTAGGSVGTAGQVLTSTGTGVEYTTLAAASGGAAFSELMLIGA